MQWSRHPHSDLVLFLEQDVRAHEAWALTWCGDCVDPPLFSIPFAEGLVQA